MNIVPDFETRSYADLGKVGAWVYSKHPTTEVLVLSYKIDDGPIQSWWPGKNATDTIPADLGLAIALGATIEPHNSSFEYSIWVNIMVKRFGWPMIADDLWRDSMATARYYALPAGLDKLVRALGGEGKNADGRRLINVYSKLYSKNAKLEIPDADKRKWVAYCEDDVAEEFAVGHFLGELPEREIPLYLLDQRSNRRGLFLDGEGIGHATAVVAKRAAKLERDFLKLTGGVKHTQRDKVLGWFEANGLSLPDMKKDTLKDILKSEEKYIPPGPVRDALQIRLQINKASTKKLEAMAAQRDPDDGRARFQTNYHGAATGRNTGSGFQPLNLVRSYEKLDPEQLVRDISYENPEYLDAVYQDAMEAVSKASRHWIMAPDGRKIYSGDFVSVEAVILACLAGEDWKIDVFRNKEPVYERTADKIYGFAPGTVTKDTHPKERQDGKVCELAFGYQGALNAWLKFDSSGRHSDEAIIGFCKAWRREHPAVASYEVGVGLWASLEDAAIDAVISGGVRGYRDIGFEVVDQWLTMILPNGKRIWYWEPKIKATMPAWHQPHTKPECAEGTCNCREKPQLSYMAVKTGKWQRVTTYGGKLTENAVQATSREVLRPAALAAEENGYNVILTVYDEIVAEVEKNFGSKKEFEQIMGYKFEPWYNDWPIHVDAWEGRRYKK